MNGFSFPARLSDRHKGVTIVSWLTDNLRNQITTGRLIPGTVFPATRLLASELGISRSSVVQSYDQLVAEGYLSARQGSAFRVSELGLADYPEYLKPKKSFALNADGNQELLKLSLVPGQPDQRLFPARKWGMAVSRVARLSPDSLLYGEDPFGDPVLRNAIVEHLAEWRGVDVVSEQVLVSAGSADGLQLCIEMLGADPMMLGLENPGYIGLRRHAERLNLKMQWLSRDECGTVLPANGASQPNLVVLTPSNHYPLGGAMTLNRRLEYINWSRETGGWIIEDDYDSEYRFAGHPIPAMIGLDDQGRTIYLGTFSKTISTDLRLGFMVIPISLVNQFRKKITASRTSVIAQRPMGEFMRAGDYHRHIRRTRRHYAERRDALELRLNEMDDLTFATPHANTGMQVAVLLNRQQNDKLIVEKLKEQGIGAVPLSDFFVNEKSTSGLLIGYCAHTVEEIGDLMMKFQDCLRDSQ